MSIGRRCLSKFRLDCNIVSDVRVGTHKSALVNFFINKKFSEVGFVLFFCLIPTSLQILCLTTGVSLSVFLSKLLFNWDVIIGKNESSSKSYQFIPDQRHLIKMVRLLMSGNWWLFLLAYGVIRGLCCIVVKI